MSRRKSRFERRKVFELKAKVDGIQKQPQKLFAIFDDSRDIETGYSIRELAAVLAPKHTDHNGEPTFYGQAYTKQIIRKWRKKILENVKEQGNPAVVVPFAYKDDLLGWIFYNMQTRKEFETVLKLGRDVIDGIEKLLQEFLKLVSMKPSQKEVINQEMRQEIRRTLLALKKARRKSS